MHLHLQLSLLSLVRPFIRSCVRAGRRLGRAATYLHLLPLSRRRSPHLALTKGEATATLSSSPRIRRRSDRAFHRIHHLICSSGLDAFQPVLVPNPNNQQRPSWPQNRYVECHSQYSPANQNTPSRASLTRIPGAQVHPLRIAKSTPSSSPTKMAGNSLPRPLSEISPTEKRRNSPSWRQYTPTKVCCPPLLFPLLFSPPRHSRSAQRPPSRATTPRHSSRHLSTRRPRLASSGRTATQRTCSLEPVRGRHRQPDGPRLSVSRGLLVSGTATFWPWSRSRNMIRLGFLISRDPSLRSKETRSRRRLAQAAFVPPTQSREPSTASRVSP